MVAYRLVYDSRHLQADCQEPGLYPEPYARQSSMGYLYYLFAINFSFYFIFWSEFLFYLVLVCWINGNSSFNIVFIV